MPADHPRDLRGPDLVTARRRLAAHRANRVSDAPAGRGWQAATAVVLAPGPRGLEVAVIQRTERVGDRWSGHLALPGGKRELGDRDLGVTAARETREEVGIELPEPDVRLDDQDSRSHGGLVASYVFTLDDRPTLRPQPSEVAAAWWVPLEDLLDPGNTVRFRRAGLPFPGIAHEGRVIWGLTHRTLEACTMALGLALPRP